MATHPDVGPKEGEVMPPSSGWVGERGLPALGERLLGNELIDVLRRRVVLYKLARVGRVGEGEGGRALLGWG